MHIVFFGKYTPALFGGIERHVQTLTQGLARTEKLKITNIVYTNGIAKSYIDSAGVHIVEVSVTKKLGSQPIALRLWQQAYCHLKTAKIVHMHFPDPYAHLMLSLLPRSIPLVVTWHADIVKQKWMGMAYRLLWPILRRPHAVCILTPSLQTSRQLSSFLQGAPLYVVNHGINAQRFELSPKLQETAQSIRMRYEERPMIFTLGRLVAYKGLDYLIRAMQKVDGHLVIAGTGPLDNSLKQLVLQLGLNNKVSFLGLLDDAEVPAWMHACDIFCLASIDESETFGIVQAEAMLCEKPVVNCFIGTGVNELSVHEQTGLTVVPKHPDELAQALNRLVVSPSLRAEYGRMGRLRVQTRYSIPAMVTATMTMYKDVLKKYYS